MTQQVKVLAAKSKDHSSIPGTHTVDRESLSYKFSDLYTFAVA